MLKWNPKHNGERSQNTSIESIESSTASQFSISKEEISNSKASTRWKKINNTLRFINASKAAIKKSSDSNCLLQKKRAKSRQRWSLLRNTFRILMFFMRITKRHKKEKQFRTKVIVSNRRRCTYVDCLFPANVLIRGLLSQKNKEQN